MPKPTVVTDFGETTASSNLFAVVELDDETNLDQAGNPVEEFLDTEEVNIRIHLQPGATVRNVRTSYGTIVNATRPQRVTRTNTVEEVVFKASGEKTTLPHFPLGGVSATWYGTSRTISKQGREVSANGVGVCDLTYSFQAWLYRLRVPGLNLADGDDFPVEVSFEVA